MQIDRAGLSVSEKMVFYLRGPELGINMRLFFTQQTAVFCFDPNDPVHCNQLTHRMAESLNEKRGFPSPSSSLPKRGQGNPLRPARRDLRRFALLAARSDQRLEEAPPLPFP